MKNTDKNKDFLSVNIFMSNLSNPIFIITTLCENSSIKSSSIRKVSLFFWQTICELGELFIWRCYFACLRLLPCNLLFYGQNQINYAVGRQKKESTKIVFRTCKFEVLWYDFDVASMLSFHSQVLLDPFQL